MGPEIKNELDEKANGCRIGLLAITGVSNEKSSEALEKAKSLLEEDLRGKYAQIERQELRSINPMSVYVSYYKKFGYTYHVLQQVESVAKGKKSMSVSGLVDSMFMAEMKNMILTAGHDLAKISGAVSLKVATGQESYVCMNGRETKTIQGDIMITDDESVLSSILRGPDGRTSIDEETEQVLYTIYAPTGIDEKEIISHMDDIESYVRLFSPGSNLELKTVI